MFEITANDLFGRTGFFTSRKGRIRTPAFVPVVHPEPAKNNIDVSLFQTQFGIDVIITSSYILRKRFGDKTKIDLHQQTKFPGPIMTDSGAYQSLVYGEIEITPENAIAYQELVDSDFGVPLDIPIAINDSYSTAQEKVLETIKRCKEVPEIVKPSGTIWIGPIQGGRYLDLIEKSAKTVSEIDSFEFYALGSVVELMSDYQYETLVDMIIATKMNLNPSKPLHLFGAGHPSMFPLIVAAGCDSFDSASYSLYAQQDRYLTSTQTLQLNEIDDFPCCCPVCLSLTPNELKKYPRKKRINYLAKHNLYICQTEIANIRRAIKTGTLWELAESKSLAHPMLRKGFKKLAQYSDVLLKNTPVTKGKGIFLYSDSSLLRSEILSHRQRMNNLATNKTRKNLLVISTLEAKISEQFKLYKSLKDIIKTNETILSSFEIWILDAYFGIIPLELTDLYPLSQYTSSNFLSKNSLQEKIKILLETINHQSFEKVIVIGKLELFNKAIQNRFLNNTPLIETFGLILKDDNSNILDEILEFLT